MTSVTFGRALPSARRANALYCTTTGTGTALLLLHGMGEDSTAFAPLIPALAKLGCAIAPDLRGHGQSHRLGSNGSTERHVADLLNLLDLLHIQRCIIVARPGAEAIARQFATRHPERVRGLVLPAPRRSLLPRLPHRRQQPALMTPTLLLEAAPGVEMVTQKIGAWMASECQIRA